MVFLLIISLCQKNPLKVIFKSEVMIVKLPTRGGEKEVKRMKRKTVWAYLDGKKLVDVVRAALDNHMMVDDMKALLIRENPGHEVTFKVQ